MPTPNAFTPHRQPRFDPTHDANRRGQVTPAPRTRLNTQVSPVCGVSLLLLIVPSAFIFMLSRIYAEVLREREALLGGPIGLIVLIVLGGMLSQCRRHSSVLARFC